MDSESQREIAHLENVLLLLQQREHRIQLILSSPNSSPAIKAQARGDLAKTIKDLTETGEDLNRRKALP
jgi:hypothetical protein